ncbi:MAG: cobalt ECF transporter T component CbiQ [Planctomycetota bacterium]
MLRIEAALNDIGVLDCLARQDSPIHRLDPRAKVLVILVFLVTAVSYGKYEVAALTPLFIFPVVLLAVGKVPVGVLVRYILLACPFAIFVGIFNPLLDHQNMIRFGTIDISGGWVSFASIIFRFVLTVSAAMILIATTGFNTICMALERLGVPRLMVTQFLLLYRYLFLLSQEAGRMTRAYSLRAVAGRGLPIRIWGSLVGHLLLRAYNRGQRIHCAMLCRGFTGDMPARQTLQFTAVDAIFIIGWLAFFALARFGDLPQRIGDLLMSLTS